jgi:hypothetical protein
MALSSFLIASVLPLSPGIAHPIDERLRKGKVERRAAASPQDTLNWIDFYRN